MIRDPLTHETIEEERYELRGGARYSFSPNRREFVQILGAGIIITVPALRAMAQRPSRRGGRGEQGGRIADRIHIGADGSITVLSSKVEVGQGARTQIAQAAAEELRVSLETVRVILGDTELCPNDGGTSGSRTTPSTVPRVRAAAAAAREALVDLAAAKFGVDRGLLAAENGTIVEATTKREVSYAALARDESLAPKLQQNSNDDISLTRVDDWTVLGSSPPIAGAKDVVTGAHRYPSDITRPGMLYGKVLRAPSYAAKLKSIDLAPAEAVEGVTVVRDGDFVGCAAASTWLAAKAIEALAKTAEWEHADASSGAESEHLSQYLKEHAETDSRGGGGGRRGGMNRGSTGEALASANRKLEAAYDIAYIQHAPMEPRAAVAEWSDGKLTVWTGTQNPSRVQGELVQAFLLAPDRVRVIVPDAGGAFGGKHTGETALEAARLAKAAGKPVSLRWTREEEFTWAYFRPAGLIEARGGLDEAGKLIAWEFANYNSGGSAIATPYDVPNVAIRSISCDAPLRSGSYRALASTANNFARESFMDELAAAASIDPLEFRLRHLASGRLRDVLVAATEKFGWPGTAVPGGRQQKERAANRGIGLACGTEKASYVAACAEVEVDRAAGTVKVIRVCQAFECGAIQNPVNLRAQVAGCIIMGLGGTREEIRFAEGRILNPRFSEYAVPRMGDLPELEIVLVNRPDLESVGAGETPIIAVAPAVANAVFDATGVRLRSLPFRTALLKQA